MNIEQLLNTKSKAEAAFMMYSNCIKCNHFCEDKYGAWKCESAWHENQCRLEYKKLLSQVLDKNFYQDIGTLIKVEYNNELKQYYCSNCSRLLDSRYTYYCPNCGKPLDWKGFPEEPWR